MRQEEQNGEANHPLTSNIQSRELHGFGIVSGGAVTVNSGTPGATDTLSVEASEVLVNGTQYSVSTQDISIDASDSNPRQDVIYVDSNGDVQVAKGTPNTPQSNVTNPSYTDYILPVPADLQYVDATVLYQVWVPSSGSITSSELIDRRTSAEIVTDSLESNSVNTERAVTDSRGPDVVIWKDSQGNVYADGKDSEVDSGTDAATVFQSAHDHLTNGGGVYIKEGEYLFSQAVEISNQRITWRGPSLRSTRLKLADGANDDLFRAVGNSDIYFPQWIDLYLDGNKANNSSGRGLNLENGTAGSDSGRVRDARVHRCFISNFTEHGIYQEHVWGFRIFDSVIEFCTSEGLHLDKGQDAKVIGCKLPTNDEGVNIRSDGTQFTENIVSDHREHGVRVGNGATGTMIANNLFVGNSTEHTNRANLFLNQNAVTKTIVIGNHFNAAGQGGYAIYTRDGGSGGPVDTRLRDNTFDGTWNTKINETGTRTRINGVGTESANAETPTASNWNIGDVVDFTDSGDGSGNGVYRLLPDGSWTQIGST